MGSLAGDMSLYLAPPPPPVFVFVEELQASWSSMTEGYDRIIGQLRAAAAQGRTRSFHFQIQWTKRKRRLRTFHTLNGDDTYKFMLPSITILFILYQFHFIFLFS